MRHLLHIFFLFSLVSGSAANDFVPNNTWDADTYTDFYERVRNPMGIDGTETQDELTQKITGYFSRPSIDEQAYDYFSDLPNRRAEDIGHDVGYGLGQTAVTIVVTKGLGRAAGAVTRSTTTGAASELPVSIGGTVRYSDDLVKAAQQTYPKLAGKTQLHHITPKYLGGASNGPVVPLDAAYHQMITNEFRALWGYGKGVPSAMELQSIMKQVYSKYPLPPGYGF